MKTDDDASMRVFTTLAEQLLNGELAPTHFERLFFARWGEDRARRSEAAFTVLERFFFVVEDYVDDASIRELDDGDLDEDQLRQGARRFLSEVAGCEGSTS